MLSWNKMISLVSQKEKIGSDSHEMITKIIFKICFFLAYSLLQLVFCFWQFLPLEPQMQGMGINWLVTHIQAHTEPRLNLWDLSCHILRIIKLQESSLHNNRLSNNSMINHLNWELQLTLQWVSSSIDCSVTQCHWHCLIVTLMIVTL